MDAPETTPVTPWSARSEIEGWARRFTQAAAEIAGGDRPASQLQPWTSREVFENLERRARLVARAGRFRPGTGQPQPVRPRVLGVRSCFVTGDVVEVSSHLRYGARSRALAVRFERIRGDWRCTALEFA